MASFYDLRSRQVPKRMPGDQSFKYIKILSNDFVHRDFTWKPNSRNDLTTDFNQYECIGGGLYVCEPKHFFDWMFNNLEYAWVSYALIPDDAQKVVFHTKVKASSVILHGPLIKLEDFIPIAVQAGANINNDYALRNAVYNNCLTIVKCLLKAGADISGTSRAICLAAEYGYLNIVKCFIENGTVHSSCIKDAINIAEDNGHVDIVKYLKKNT